VNNCVSPFSNTANVTVKALPATPVITQNGNVLSSSAAAGNQWFFNGTAIAGATGQNHTATASGSYTVIVTANDCTSTASNALNFVATSINDPVLEKAVILYPNPVNDQLNVKLSGSRLMVLSVMDITGRILDTSSPFRSTYELKMAGFAAGTYLVRLTDVNSGKQVVKMIMKQPLK
jgi:hypothetical protein